jgi:hypothetical protein
MRTFTQALFVSGAAAAVVFGATATGANAATTCTEQTVTLDTATFHATQPSGGGGNWDHTYSVTVAADGGFTGTNVITGLDGGQMTTVNETVSGQITDKNGDGVQEVTLVSVRTSGFYTFEWSVTDAPMDGQADSMEAGTVTYATAKDWAGGPLPITFTSPVFDTDTKQSCTTTPPPATGKDNHGEYVSGAAHAGVKGNALAKIAKDVTLVGPYKG